MKDLTFYFVPELNIDFMTREKVEILRPKIPIRFLAKNRRITNPFDCLFDTGADRCLFPAELGKALGLNVEKGRESKTIGIDNVPITTYSHNISFFIGSKKIDTSVDFAYKINILLLGRDGFMNHFEHIEFNEVKKYVKVFYKE